ncbi:MAG: glutathione binding-like protein [Pseudomonadota bacterium]
MPYAAKHIFGHDGVDLDAAGEDVKKYAAVLDGHLQGRDWLVGDTMTTADICVSATLCLKDICQYPLGDYANIKRWFSQIEAMDAWQRAAPQVEAA